jgi:hypothetical protein
MLNSLEVYADTGRKAAEAINDGDYARYRFHRDWLTRALALESKTAAETARNTYAYAYSLARKI